MITTHTEALVTGHKVLCAQFTEVGRQGLGPFLNPQLLSGKKSLQVQLAVFLGNARPHDADSNTPAACFIQMGKGKSPPQPGPGFKRLTSVRAPENISCR